MIKTIHKSYHTLVGIGDILNPKHSTSQHEHEPKDTQHKRMFTYKHHDWQMEIFLFVYFLAGGGGGGAYKLPAGHLRL